MTSTWRRVNGEALPTSDHGKHLERQRREQQQSEPNEAPAGEGVVCEDTEIGYVVVNDPDKAEWKSDESAYIPSSSLGDAVSVAKHLGIKTATTALNCCRWVNINKVAGKAKDVAGNAATAVASVARPLVTSTVSAVRSGFGALEESSTNSYITKKRVVPIPTLHLRQGPLNSAVRLAMEDHIDPEVGRWCRRVESGYMYDENDAMAGEFVGDKGKARDTEEQQEVLHISSLKCQKFDDAPLDASAAWQRKPDLGIEADRRDRLKREWSAKGEKGERSTEEDWVRRIR